MSVPNPESAPQSTQNSHQYESGTTSEIEFNLWVESQGEHIKGELEAVRRYFELSEIQDAAFLAGELDRGSRLLVEHKNKVCSELAITPRIES